MKPLNTAYAHEPLASLRGSIDKQTPFSAHCEQRHRPLHSWLQDLSKESDMSTQQTLNTLAQTSPEALRTTTGPLTMRWACEKGMLIARWAKTEPSKGARRVA